MNDLEYMKIAIHLAKKGAGLVNPNPMVGAVIVKNDSIIGKGYHEKYGGLHAERNALRNCTQSSEGATLYVTLEPCCHYGKTPPCTDAIISSGIKRVVIGTLDPNPLVAGKSVKILQKQHIQVDVGILEKECMHLIRTFKKYISTKLPYVLMKYAMTMDGKIATYTKQSQWISCEESRKQVHKSRNEFSAIMVGVNTVIQDNPLLTCRIPNGKNPIRIICDTHLRTPIDSKIIQTAHFVKTYIATSCFEESRIALYTQYGCQCIQIKKKDNHIDLNDLMKKLGEMHIDSILLEGGSTLNWSAMKEHIVDEVHTYIAPKIFGGKANSPIEGEGIDTPSKAFQLIPYSTSQLGEDILIESEVNYTCLQVS